MQDRPHYSGSAERRVLLGALEVRGAADAINLDKVLWPEVVQVAREAKVLSTLAACVLPHRASQLDAATHDVLRNALEETSAWNTRLLAELARCVGILRSAHVDHVALKGAVLLAEHYPRIGQRHTVDIDLLVDPQRFDAALAALRDAGYKDHPHYATTLVGDGSSLANAWPGNQHACPPLLSPSGVTMDVHHRVPVSDFERSGGFHGWFARSHAYDVHGVRVQMCDRLDLAAHLCEHFVLQHQADPVDAPRLLCDLRALFPDTPPWSQLQTGSTRRRISIAVVKALYEAVFERPQARDPVSRLLQRVAIADPSVVAPLAELSHLRGHAERFAFNARHRPGYALRSVFPTREYMAQQYGVDPGSPRVYPLYVKRLFTTLWRTR